MFASHLTVSGTNHQHRLEHHGLVDTLLARSNSNHPFSPVEACLSRTCLPETRN